MILTTAAAAAVTSVAPALADTDSVSDPRGDTMGHPSGSRANVDIVGSSAGDAKHGKIVQTVKVAGKAGDPHHGGLVPLLYINVASYGGGTRECDFYVGRLHGRDGVFTCATQYRVGSATVTRKSGNTIRYVFSPRAIGKPSEYEWAFVLQAKADGTIEDFDRVPDTQVGMETYRVR
ncbi:MAG: hypothetical protein QOD53_937 [Thermoleophilaceae bacterium]|nr:hypothetical protein [Thermoleophilaceae bacterium]